MPDSAAAASSTSDVSSGNERGASLRGRAKTLLALTKPRLAVFSILSGLAGYAVAYPASGDGARLGAAFAGIALAAGGALSFNQWWERKTDALMRRTAGRPLPRGEIGAAGALAWSLTLSLGGVGLLAAWTTPPAALIAATIIVLYGLVYTPLKRRTRWATEIGSLSGALPPVLGAAAAGDAGSTAAWVLAGVILFWQMPHFFAVGWMYREDYRAAGFPLLPAIDPDGARTAAWSLAHSLLLAAASLAPWALGVVGPIYGVVAALGAAMMVRASWRFLVRPGERDANGRRLFFATIVYLPPVMTALVVDRW